MVFNQESIRADCYSAAVRGKWGNGEIHTENGEVVRKGRCNAGPACVESFARAAIALTQSDAHGAKRF